MLSKSLEAVKALFLLTVNCSAQNKLLTKYTSSEDERFAGTASRPVEAIGSLKKYSVKNIIRRFTLGIMLATLLFLSPHLAQSAQFTPNDNGTLLVSVEKHDTFGQILLDAGYKGQLWGSHGHVAKLRGDVENQIATKNVSRIKPGYHFSIPNPNHTPASAQTIDKGNPYSESIQPDKDKQQETDSLKAQADQFKTQLEQLQSQVTQLQSQKDALAGDFNLLKQEKETLEKHFSDLKRQLAQAKSELDQAKSKATPSIDNIWSAFSLWQKISLGLLALTGIGLVIFGFVVWKKLKRLEGLHGKITDLQQRVSDLERQRIEEESKLTAPSPEAEGIDQIRKEVEAASKRVQELGAEGERLQQAVNSLNEEKRTIEAWVKAQTEEKERLEHRVADLTTQEQSLAERIAEFRQQGSGLAQSQRDLTAQIEAKATELKAIEVQITGLDQNNADTVIQLADLIRQRETVQTQIATLSQQLSELSSEAKRKQAELADLEMELRAKQTQLQQLKEELDQFTHESVTQKGTIEQEISGRRQTLQELDSEISRLSQQRDGLIAQINETEAKNQQISRETEDLIREREQINQEVTLARQEIAGLEENRRKLEEAIVALEKQNPTEVQQSVAFEPPTHETVITPHTPQLEEPVTIKNIWERPYDLMIFDIDNTLSSVKAHFNEKTVSLILFFLQHHIGTHIAIVTAQSKDEVEKYFLSIARDQLHQFHVNFDNLTIYTAVGAQAWTVNAQGHFSQEALYDKWPKSVDAHELAKAIQQIFQREGIASYITIGAQADQGRDSVEIHNRYSGFTIGHIRIRDENARSRIIKALEALLDKETNDSLILNRYRRSTWQILVKNMEETQTAIGIPMVDKGYAVKHLIETHLRDKTPPQPKVLIVGDSFGKNGMDRRMKDDIERLNDDRPSTAHIWLRVISVGGVETVPELASGILFSSQIPDIGRGGPEGTETYLSFLKNEIELKRKEVTDLESEKGKLAQAPVEQMEPEVEIQPKPVEEPIIDRDKEISKVKQEFTSIALQFQGVQDVGDRDVFVQVSERLKELTDAIDQDTRPEVSQEMENALQEQRNATERLVRAAKKVREEIREEIQALSQLDSSADFDARLTELQNRYPSEIFSEFTVTISGIREAIVTKEKGVEDKKRQLDDIVSGFAQRYNDLIAQVASVESLSDLKAIETKINELIAETSQDQEVQKIVQPLQIKAKESISKKEQELVAIVSKSFYRRIPLRDFWMIFKRYLLPSWWIGRQLKHVLSISSLGERIRGIFAKSPTVYDWFQNQNFYKVFKQRAAQLGLHEAFDKSGFIADFKVNGDSGKYSLELSDRSPEYLIRGYFSGDCTNPAFPFGESSFQSATLTHLVIPAFFNFKIKRGNQWIGNIYAVVVERDGKPVLLIDAIQIPWRHMGSGLLQPPGG
jgi:DNA repair exonuclease SbcCD ATPase subunit/hydroxymethylpyrimidine pyrophosphatase-like HAD family hydrolase